MIVDVRKMPRSRTNPQFNSDALPVALAERQIGYRHIATLGGLRGRSPALAVSPNTLWRNKSFRNYADYALTPPFKIGLAELVTLSQSRTCAIMCAEVLWWRCHRRIIADYLLAGDAAVSHILTMDDIKPATLTHGAERVPEGQDGDARREAQDARREVRVHRLRRDDGRGRSVDLLLREEAARRARLFLRRAKRQAPPHDDARRAHRREVARVRDRRNAAGRCRRI